MPILEGKAASAPPGAHRRQRQSSEVATLPKQDGEVPVIVVEDDKAGLQKPGAEDSSVEILQEPDPKKKPWVQRHKALLYNIGAASGYVATSLFFAHAVRLVVMKQEVHHEQVGIICGILIGKLSGMPYKWDKFWMRVTVCFNVSIYSIVLFLYIISIAIGEPADAAKCEKGKVVLGENGSGDITSYYYYFYGVDGGAAAAGAATAD